MQLRQLKMVKIELKIAFSLITLLLIISLYLYINEDDRPIPTNIISAKTNPMIVSQQKSTISSSMNIFYKNNTLLDVDNFKQRTERKRALSLADTRTNFLSCITEDIVEIDPILNTEFKNQLFACMKLHIPIEEYELDSFKAINVEHKRFLPMDKVYYENAANPCLYLTVGIGNHTQAEREFLKLYPRCKMFGVEISPYNVGDFANFGKVIPVGIGVKQEVETLDNYTYGAISNHNLTLKPFYMVLDQDVGSRIVHYATIDIEGYEFDLLKEFENLGQYEINGIVMCQMDIEFHFANKDIRTFLLRFFHNAFSYLPVYAGPYPQAPQAIKMTVINVKNVDCEHAFHFSKYFYRSK